MPALSVDENGFETEGYEDYRTVWACISKLSGREYFQAASVQKEETVIFLIRDMADVDETMRIVFKGKKYNIISIDNFKHEHRYLEIKALEVEQGG